MHEGKAKQERHSDPASSKKTIPFTPEFEQDSELVQRLLGVSDARHLKQGDIVQLQRVLGNQRVQRLQSGLLAQQSRPIQIVSGHERGIQRRKSKLDETDFVQHMRDGLGVNEEDLKAKFKPDAWTYANGLYKTFVEKGVGYWKTLEKAIAAYGGKEKEAFLKDQKIKRADYDERFEKEYDFTMGLDDSTSFVNSKNNETEMAYTNAVTGGEDYHSITAKKNYKDKDKAKPPLPNSEILWQQFKKTREKLGGGSDEDLAKIDNITRSEIVNIDTLVTVYMAYPDGEKITNNPKKWKPGTEEFYAILGTENVRSSAHFLTDHVDQIHKTIDFISTEGKEVVVHFKAI